MLSEEHFFYAPIGFPLIDLLLNLVCLLVLFVYFCLYK